MEAVVETGGRDIARGLGEPLDRRHGTSSDDPRGCKRRKQTDWHADQDEVDERAEHAHQRAIACHGLEVVEFLAVTKRNGRQP